MHDGDEVAGWADGYRNTPLKAVEGLGARTNALITATDWLISAEATAFEDESETEVHRKTWEKRIPRDFM